MDTARAARGALPAWAVAAAVVAAAAACATAAAGGWEAAGGNGWQPAFAQASEPILTVSTARTVYDHGDNVVIHGNVRIVVEDTPVLFTVFYTAEGRSPAIRHAGQEDVSQDGSFTHVIRTSSGAWPAGEYTVKAHYSVHGTVETSFTIAAPPSTVESTAIHVVDAGSSGTFDVPYTVLGGTVDSMRINPDSLGMSVFIEAGRGGGSLTLELPRRYIDARTAGCEGGDELFIILVDGAQTPYEKITDMSDKRVVKVPFNEGDAHVEIIGTCVVPEFGAAALAALAAAAGAAALLSRRAAGGWGGGAGGLLPRP